MNNTKLNVFLDNNDIQTGNNLEGDYITLVYDSKMYDIIEKLHETSLLIKNKGLKNNEFMQFFENIGQLDYQENWVYCGGCGNYAHHDYYGVNDQYYIDDEACEVVCKIAWTKPSTWNI